MKTVTKYPVLALLVILAGNAVNGDLFNFLTDEIDKIIQLTDDDLYLIGDKLKTSSGSKVNIKLYYECHCNGCRNFESEDFKKTIEKLDQYLEVETFPYGNARTHENGDEIEITCQHGPAECYGNKLHACALDIVKNHTAALLYNACMMSLSQQNKGSDDPAADKCGSSLGVDSAPIKECAKAKKGTELLKHYGEESEKAGFNYVPYVLINGNEYNGHNFLQDVCATFANPPPPCSEN